MSLATVYRRFRKASPFMLDGRNAQMALTAAKVLMQWRALERAGLVQVISEPDDDPDASFYDTWTHLSERTREQLKADYYSDCWVVSGEYRVDEDSKWWTGDSTGGCAGYSDPCSAFENCYVIDIMHQTISELKAALKSRCPVCRKVA